jgi:DNA-binding transcriptional ArsR family regulator
VLLWIVKNRHSKKFAKLLNDLITPRLLSAIFFAIDYEALQAASARRIPLGDILSDDTELIADLLSTADPETARDLANTLLLNQGFEELTKKSLLARFIKIFPNIQSLVAADAEGKEEQLLVSRESFERKREEYEAIVSKKIPENSKAIAAAREHGDLRENSEYKMAKQDQQVLMAQKSQLERELARARITDFKDATVEQVAWAASSRSAPRTAARPLHDPRRLGRRPGAPRHLLQDPARRGPHRQAPGDTVKVKTGVDRGLLLDRQHSAVRLTQAGPGDPALRWRREIRTLLPAVNSSWDTLKILSDPTRLRLIALVMREELSVAELQEILGMGQSRISSQLALLRQASLVADRRDGKKAFYSLRPNLPAGQLALIRAAVGQRGGAGRHRRGRPAPGPGPRQAPARLRAVLQPHRRPPRAQPLPGALLGGDRPPRAQARAAGRRRRPGRRGGPHLAAPRPQREAGVVHRQLPRMVEVGTELARKNDLTNLTYKLGDIEQVPLPTSRSTWRSSARRSTTRGTPSGRWTRPPDPAPGGQLLILELAEHDFEKARELYADLWLGFKESALEGFLKKAKFIKIEVTPVSREAVEPHFETLLATGTKA